ncbi:MAG: hypothetical protein JWQ42_1982 [Edaphobacter sp.]|nr:hypothetical protein [Edaphobacter sp.]
MRPSLKTCFAVITLLALSAIVYAQTEPTTPAAQAFHDTRHGVSFQIPAAWNLSRKDSDLSTFNLDARTAPKNAQLRAVADIAFNPYPRSTFTGAFFYFSITPKTTPAACAQQASAQAPRTVTTARIGGIPFTHGYDEHGGICTESRDEIYTAQRNNACYRFDLIINTFCGGDAGAGARDITPRELEFVRRRMQAILDSVRFDAK